MTIAKGKSRGLDIIIAWQMVNPALGSPAGVRAEWRAANAEWMHFTEDEIL